MICPKSFMGPAEESVRNSVMGADGMGKYDRSVDNESAYEILEEQAKRDEERARLEAERAALEAERAEFEKQKAKEEEAARKNKEKEEEAAARKREKEEEARERRRERAAERRRNQIERTLISTGAQVLKRGLFNTLFKK